MKAILFDTPGDPSVLYVGESPTPVPAEKEILVKVRATALNRADTLQRKGLYPPPPGASSVLGLEMAGEVVEVGKSVTQWKVGDPVMALLPGGGYAEYVCIPEEMGMGIPAGLSFEQAAAIPEVFLTAFQAIFWLGKLQNGEKMLIHAGASGVGTAAIQLAKSLGAQVYVTSSPSKHNVCLELGADQAIDYRSEDFSKRVAHFTKGKGVDMILDFLAASYLDKNLASLAVDGRLVLLALMGGSQASQFDMGKILRKRIHLMGSTLRARSLAYKIELTKAFYTYSNKKFESGIFKPVIDSVVSWEEVVAAHQRMEANLTIGKIVLTLT